MALIYSFLILLVSSIYWFAAQTFKIFTVLSSSKIFEYSQYEKLITNMYVVIGVVMLFIIAFSLLKSMIDPEGKGAGTEVVTKIIGKFLTSILILIFLPTIFNFAFQFQDAIINQGTIGRLFGNNATVSKTDKYSDLVSKSSSQMVNGVFTAFFYPNLEHEVCRDTNRSIVECSKKIESGSGAAAQTLYGSINYVNDSGYINSEYTTYSDSVADGEIVFNWFLALLAGLALIYVVISFCFDLGIRLVKLIFYQVIAPIPIMLRVVPNGKLSETFNSWIKVTSACYFEVFIRLFALYLGMFLFSVLPLASDIMDTFNVDSIVALLAYAFLIMGVVVFIKQLPSLLGEVLGFDSSNMKLGIREKLANGGAFAAGAAIGSMATSGVRRFMERQKGIKDEWKKTIGKDGSIDKKARAKLIGKTLRSGILAAHSGVAGVGAGLKAGYNAKSAKEMKEAAGKGASAVSDKRAKKAHYKAGHGKTIGGVINGRVNDAWSSVKDWAYDQSAEGLQKTRDSMDKLESSYSTYEDNTSAMINKEMDKGQGGIFKVDENGKSVHGFSDEIMNQLDQVKAQKKVYEEYLVRYNSNDENCSYDELQRLKGDLKKSEDDFRDSFMNIGFEGRESETYMNLSEKAQATIKQTFVDAENLKTQVMANANTDVVKNSIQAGTIDKIREGKTITVKDFEVETIIKLDDGTEDKQTSKLKSAAKKAKGDAEVMLAERGTSDATKGKEE